MGPNPNTSMLDDRTIASDVLTTTKTMADAYAKSAIESASPQIRQTLASFYMEGLSCNEKVFRMMENRGWYSVSKADQQQISQIQNKFGSQPNQWGQHQSTQTHQSIHSMGTGQSNFGTQSNIRY